ncbi:MAG: presenilin family intramembrane aspartyl protease [Patescibacteria group bacterium]
MKHRFFLVLFFLLAGLCVIGILAAARAFPSSVRFQTVASWQYVFVGVIAATLIIGFFRKFRSRLLWEALFLTTLFLGVWFAMFLILPIGWALALAAILTLAQVFVRIVIVHDLFYLVGGAGVAINFAGLLSPELLVVGLVAFTVYDMVAGPPGGPIQTLASILIRKGIVPGLIVPARRTEILENVDVAVKGNAAFLGAGDLILPLTLVARAALRETAPALIVLAGLLVGALFLTERTDLHPRTALPLLAVGAAIPFLALRFFALI